MNPIVWVVAFLLLAGAAIRVTWLARKAIRRPEPVVRAADDSSNASNDPQTHDVMTTSDGTKAIIRSRKPGVPGS